MITLLCVATGNPKPTITWTKGSSVKQQTSITNFTISSAAKEDAGLYTCTARVTVPDLSVPSDNYQVTVTVRCKCVQFVSINMVFLNWVLIICMKCYVNVLLYAPFSLTLNKHCIFPLVFWHFTWNSHLNSVFITLKSHFEFFLFIISFFACFTFHAHVVRTCSSSLCSMAVLSSWAQERHSSEIRARSARERAAKPREK